MINIKVTAEEAKRKSKKEWKKDVKEKIRKEIDKQLNENRSTKLRFCKRRGIDSYLQDVHNETAKEAMKIRLNMVEWIPDNYGRKEGCPLCHEEDSTEHIFECTKIGNNEVSINNLEEGSEMKKIVELFKRTEKERRQTIQEEILVKMALIKTV